jgi:exonuclease III
LNYWFKEKVSYIYIFNYHCGQTIFFVTIEYNKTLKNYPLWKYKDNEGRLLLINVEINNAIYTIINIYAPNNTNKRNTFFKQVDRFINEHSIGQIILAGDYNDILSKIDTKNYINP